MRWHVDAWDPAYGTSFEPAEGSVDGTPDVKTDIEREPASWRPLDAPGDVRVPDVVLLVDGVRRNDASLWSTEDDGTSHPGLAASYAAGVVRCDLRRGVADLVTKRVARGLFTPSPSATDLVAGQVHYRLHRVETSDPAKLHQYVQPQLTQLEVEVSVEARPPGLDEGELLVVDGPLRNRRHLANTLGYVKSQRQPYLPTELIPVVTALRPTQRTPVFLRGTRWRSYSWYLRLPGPAGAPWTGIVRVECPPDLTHEAAIRLADRSAVVLPRFASTAYKDPRAPQNLIPIAGLERRLRGLLGDPRLLHRALMLAAARAPAAVNGRDRRTGVPD
jgi:hypothetical protein